LREAENELTRDDLTGAQRNKANRKADELRSKVREVREFETKLVEMASHRTTFDLDDGVKANYPLFYPLVEPVKGLDKARNKKIRQHVRLKQRIRFNRSSTASLISTATYSGMTTAVRCWTSLMPCSLMTYVFYT
jgi:hypothetical protein